MKDTNIICNTLHQTFNKMDRIRFPFEDSQIPKNGIYILFERGERSHGGDRIVRIGTHTGDDQLPSRIKQHFLMENKDRSIFRKNIGRSLLNREKSSFLEKWNLDLTTKVMKEKHAVLIDMKFQKETEGIVVEALPPKTTVEELEMNVPVFVQSLLILYVALPDPSWPAFTRSPLKVTVSPAVVCNVPAAAIVVDAVKVAVTPVVASWSVPPLIAAVPVTVNDEEPTPSTNGLNWR